MLTVMLRKNGHATTAMGLGAARRRPLLSAYSLLKWSSL
jgi:hypothetical protein